MRALVLQEFGRMAVEERDTPTPKAGEVLIAVTATGICGSDVHGFTGENGRRIPGQVMGHESVGKVAGFGPDTPSGGLAIDAVVTFNPVVVTGQDAKTYAGREQHSPNKTVIGVATDISAAFADYVVVPVQNVVALPADLPISHGALIEPLAVAVHAVRRVRAEKGQKALVIGGGPIGQSAVLALRMEGVADIVVSEVDENRRLLCARIGATVVDPKDGSVVDQVRATFGQLADVTIDAVGITPTIADALNATAFGGSVCLVGMGARTLSLDAFRISTEERSLVGSFTYSAQDFRDAASWVASSPPELGELISREVPLDEANDAFVGLAKGDGTAGKVLVRFDS
jgi:L-iditol 2-dehydrogenase